MVAAALEAETAARRDPTWLLLGGILVLAAALRFWDLGAASLWEDEIAAIEISRAPLATLWSSWMVRETNPPLYYSLLHLWMQAFGDSAFAVRSLSTVAGVAAVWLIFLVGRAVASSRVGMIAALLAALWSHQVYYSQEARGYIFGACAALVAMLGLVRIADRVQSGSASGGGAGPWLLYLGGCLAAVYVHTTNVFLPFLANLYFAWLWLFRTERRGADLGAWTAVNALLVAGWAWWGFITWLQVSRPDTNISWIPRTSLFDALNIVTIAYGPTGLTWENGPLRAALQIGGGGAILLGAAWGALKLRRDRGVMLAVFAVGLPFLVYLVSLHTPMMLPRVLLWGLAPVIVGLASALAAIRSWTVLLGALAAVAAVLTVGRTLQNPKEPWAQVVAELDRRVQPGELVLTSGAGLLVQHYCDKLHCRFQTIDVLGPSEAIHHWREGMFRGRRPHPAEVPALIAGRPRVWTVTLAIQDPRPFVAPYAVQEPTPFDFNPGGQLVVASWRPKPSPSASAR